MYEYFHSIRLLKQYGLAVTDINSRSFCLCRALRIGAIMNFTDSLITLAQTAESTKASLFPFPIKFHIVFACIALIFFAYRFATDKKPYQLIFAIAIPFSLMIWLSDVKGYFYLIGAIELIMIIAALVTSIVCKPKEKAESAAEKTESAEENAVSDEEASSEE